MAHGDGYGASAKSATCYNHGNRDFPKQTPMKLVRRTKDIVYWRCDECGQEVTFELQPKYEGSPEGN